jgi:hypothetical protein
MPAKPQYPPKTAAAWTAKIVLGLISIGSLVLLFFLLWRAYCMPSHGFDYTGAGELLLTIVLGVEGIIAVVHLEQTRRDGIHEVVVKTLDDYCSAPMLVAIYRLWDFWYQHQDPKDLVKSYNDLQEKEFKAIFGVASGPSSVNSQRSSVDAVCETLHHQRRTVTRYYVVLASLLEQKVLSEEFLRVQWSKKDLSIIPKILLPIERGFATRLGTAPPNYLR